jgi:hypothetical protein
MNDSMVYSFASPEQRTHEAADAAYRYWWNVYNKQHGHLKCRDQYPASGWTMEELIGSEWINLHTRTIIRVEGIEVDRWGHTVFTGHTRGLWWTNRYVVDHDIRWDVLTPDEQFTWYVARLAYCDKQLISAEKDYQQHKDDAWNVASKLRDFKRAQQELNQAADGLQAFARLHRFAVSTEHLNAGLVSIDDKPVQMRLF